MTSKWNFFNKFIILFFLFLIPIVYLYSNSHRNTMALLKEQITNYNLNQLSFLVNEIDTNAGKLATFPIMLNQDPDIREFQSFYLSSKLLDLDQIDMIQRVETKLVLQSTSSVWPNELSLYSTSLDLLISTNTMNNKQAFLKEVMTHGQGWNFIDKGKKRAVFSYTLFDPFYKAGGTEETDFILEMQFPASNIEHMLNRYKDEDGNQDPFFYSPSLGGDSILYNGSSDRGKVRALIADISVPQNREKGELTKTLDGKKYKVFYVKSKQLGWYLVDYIPEAEVLGPIIKNRDIFYGSTGLLMLLVIVAITFIYRQVKLPIQQLVYAVNRIKIGDFSYRISIRPKSEFRFLLERYNYMAMQIEQLIENVYKEKIHSREAVLKQLQSQINPHFLYNCLAYINSMAKLQDHDAVIAMSYHLSKYYRKTTRVENQTIPLQEELDLVHSYLEIYKLRMNRLEYQIDIPDAMRRLSIPRLILQPVVENAIIHGIEQKKNSSMLRIRGEIEGGVCLIHVEEDGFGLTDDEMERLAEKLWTPLNEEMGCGLWNVHQRLIIKYGESSGLSFLRSELGGLHVVIRWDEPGES
ncbi:sensor histidine kinase [Paenibacillus sp. A14]|uniref:sensor histidine kinase n=1 Tax=Paenibacillus sp. A14 TaxID=3119820 RepID=UPI002FE2747D